MKQVLHMLIKNYPNITKLSSIGKSVEGRDLYVIEITRDPGKHIPGKFLMQIQIFRLETNKIIVLLLHYR